MKKKLYKVFRGSRGSCAKSDKLLQVMSQHHRLGFSKQDSKADMVLDKEEKSLSCEQGNEDKEKVRLADPWLAGRWQWRIGVAEANGSEFGW